MALRVWLHRSAPNDVDAHWALALGERCERYKVLPGTGGAYDQDEWLMVMMEQASGVSALFDAGGQQIVSHAKRLELHTRLQNETVAFIELVNSRDNAKSGT